ncbi:alpha/beta hydrolase [Pseudomonas capsici]|uniref:alpha/beta hydrolase n=1 Tax=Pseudomonas capsici TaxID=2810614 RepID=UPI0021F14BC9|nr:alpha/beta hydrolase [Pseudomonas capsici]MCV4340862.1 alpha/beta hydrolase [Pseudomonas capsici]
MGALRQFALACTAGTIFAFSNAAFSATASSSPVAGTHMQKVSFKNNNGTKLVGDVYFPEGFDKTKTYPAIVTIPPAGGAKEQTAGIYASKMANKGFITIAIDASFQGESGGEPRYKEDPIARVEDIRGSVDYLVSLPYVDENRIGVLGICAGGGYAASAAMTERRIKAVGLAVPVDGGSENRAAGKEATIQTLEAIAMQRTAEARGGKPMVIPWIPDEYKNSDDIDLREAYNYYRTPRAYTPNWQNKMRFVSLDAVMAFDAFAHADMLLTQPLEIITGSKVGAFGSMKTGQKLYKLAASTSKDLMVVEGASHFDMYDNPKYVDQAVGKFDQFFHANLK